MLSRVQALSQLFVIGSVPRNKFYASPKALKELERLNSISVNENPSVWEREYKWCLKIAALNCQSLKDKLANLRVDKILMMGDVLCLSETLLLDDTAHVELDLPPYELSLNSVGAGKGVASYFKPELVSVVCKVKKPAFQIMKLSSNHVDVLNVYRSSGTNDQDLVNELTQIISQQKMTVVCGDFNHCFKTKKGNVVSKKLGDMGFVQLVNQATHLRGGHIDHIYSNHDQANFDVDVQIYSPYYTSLDHDALCVTVRKKVNKQQTSRYITA